MGYFAEQRQVALAVGVRPSITVEFFELQTTYLGAALGRSPQLASSDDSMPLIEPLDVQHLTHP
jgi:hypothetical protein